MNRIGRALAGLLGIGMLETTERGSFHLPIGAHLGKGYLAAGDYTVTIERSGDDEQSSILIQGDDSSIYAVPLDVNPHGSLGMSSLEVLGIDGEYFVSKYKSSAGGRVFSFPVPKAAERGCVETHTLEVAA